MDLTGKLLIAMPGMGDPRFDRAVIMLCSHAPDGAMGLIVNKPAAGIDLAALLSHLEVETTAEGLGQHPVRFGGPVETGRGFVLHSRDYASRLQTLPVTDDIGMTATVDVIEDIARGKGPRSSLVCLGYSGWGPGQLEGEIAQNAWLTTDAPADLVFDLPDAAKWEGALRQLGIDPLALSASAGRA